MSATCIYRIRVCQSNKLNVLPRVGYLTTRDLEKFKKMKVKYFKDIFLEKKKIILITPWWHTSFLQRGREKTRVACLKSGVIFKGKASFKACLFGTIPLRILDLRYFAFVTTEWMNYLQMNSSAILARTEENMAGLIFLQDNRWPGRLMRSLPNEKKKFRMPSLFAHY